MMVPEIVNLATAVKEAVKEIDRAIDAKKSGAHNRHLLQADGILHNARITIDDVMVDSEGRTDAQREEALAAKREAEADRREDR